jgi:error-prone DNA polymerase
MTKATYVPLSVLSNYSFLEGASFPEELVTRAAALDLPALAITDRDGMYGIVRAHVTARQLGVKLIIGATVTRRDGPPLTLLATRRAGYAAICKLISLGRAAVDKGRSLVTTEEVLEHAHKHTLLIHPALHRESRVDSLKAAWKDRFYAGVARYMVPGDEQRIAAIKGVAAGHRLPLVAAPAVFFHTPRRKDLADLLAAIRYQKTLEELSGRSRLPNANFTFLHPAALARIYQDVPGALARTLEVADRCTFSLDELKYHYPREVVPEGKTSMGHLVELTRSKARDRYRGTVPEPVRQQLRHELKLIEELNYPNYFLTMYDIVSYARGQGILCQGRGSAANSAVCYVLGITSVDPVRGNLLFERFISRERDEPPDIDVDFEHERREEVIQYIYRRYGQHRAAMVAEFIRYRTRSAIRDVGKALGFSVPQVTRLSNLASSYRRDSEDWWEQTIRTAGYQPDNPRIQAFSSLVRRIQAFPRHLSVHVGGFIISDIPVRTLVPVEPARMENRTVIQWDKEDVEDAGLLKIDILGLGMLSCLRRSFELLRSARKVDLDLVSIPPADPATYDMIRKADTVGVFQIESRAQMSMLPRLKPTSFYDLVVEIAIVRPGPIQGKMVHPYLRRRQGQEEVTYPLPELEPVLARTYGVPLFQEQVMKLAMVAGDFSGGEADQLRRAMGTWRSGGRLDGILGKLMMRMEAKGITHEFARQIADQIRGFGEYGFPESHAASFALLAYASAYLKCHYPAAFTAGLLNAQPMGFYSPATLVEDARRHGVEIRGVCVNTSDWDCALEALETKGEEEVSLRLGFRLVRGLRRKLADQLSDERKQRGPFASLSDLVERLEVPVSGLLKLALAGAFAGFGFDRRAALWAVLAMGKAEHHLLRGRTIFSAPTDLAPLSDWEEVLADLDATSVFLSQHPFELVYPTLKKRRRFYTAKQIHEEVKDGCSVTVGGLAVVRQRPPTAGGVLFLTLEDQTGFHNLVIHTGTMKRYRQVLLEEPILLVDGRLEKADGVANITVRKVQGIEVKFSTGQIKKRDFK